MTDLFGNKSFEELEKLLQTVEDDNSRIDILNALAWKRKDTSPNEALQYARQGLELSEKLGDSDRIGNSLIHFGIIHAKKGAITQSVTCFERALKIKEGLGDLQSVAMCYNNLALVSKKLNDYGRAMELFRKSLAIKEQIGDKLGIAYCLNNIQGIYESIGDFDTALEYVERSLEIIREIGTEKEIAKRYHNIGNILRRKGESDRAMSYFQESFELNKKFGNLSSLAADYNAMAEIHRVKGEFDEALASYLKSLELFEKLEDKFGIADALLNIGTLYCDTCETTKAIEYSTRALALSREIGSIQCEKQVSDNLSRTYEMLGDYSNALYYHKRLKTLNDEILGAEQVRRIGQVPPSAP